MLHYNSFLKFDDFDGFNLFKRDNMGSLFQNLYLSANGFFIIFGFFDSMCNIDDSSIEVIAGQTVPSSVPSIVGVLHNT